MYDIYLHCSIMSVYSGTTRGKDFVRLAARWWGANAANLVYIARIIHWWTDSWYYKIINVSYA